ncbi:unnamed protein product [Bemisia tabaci]|uniref:Protein-lysine N-methyltransferase BEMITA_LOCUS7455 n=2 Tax=Bemisia tabaci TaxID=7038 RepID=A0A9P0ABZ2_BEMTA|nr:unnamed protein product [Bemisia tabaci]
MSEPENELTPCELGTREYWENTYQLEMRNFSDHGDVGEVWFGEDSEMRIISWLSRNEEIPSDAPIIDLGCGNGMMLIELAREGYTNLTGVDYSQKAVDLAKAVVKAQDIECIKLESCDILSDEFPSKQYIVVHDKGTYDAISLCPDNASAKRKKYMVNVSKILAPEGVFIITSCNWTAEELLDHFSEDFKMACVIPAPAFKFGGKTGSLVSSVVFKKKTDVS